MKFKVTTGEYFKKQGKDILEKKQIIISLYDMQTGISYPHPISDFLYERYHKEAGSINSELNAANKVVPFLNFVLDKVELKDNDFIEVKGICDLKINHANLFLEYCSLEKGNKIQTLKEKENYLALFYDFLDQRNVLKTKPKFIIEKVVIDGKTHERRTLDFSYCKPDERYTRETVKRKDMVPQKHKTNGSRQIIRLNYIREFLLLASEIVPDIAFGIALQFYGGLRVGEVVNLTTAAIKPQNGSLYGSSGIIIEIRDRQVMLFKSKTANPDDQVKRERDQSALTDPILCYLYANHINRVLKNTEKRSNVDALFFNYDGTPMRGHTFRDRYDNLKSYYLGLLSNTKGRYEDYKDFAYTKWSTHIGRGAFTNFCLDAGFSETQTAILRGDKSIKAMKDYKDLISATYNISKAIGLLEPLNAENLTGFNIPNSYKCWKEVVEFAKIHRI